MSTPAVLRTASPSATSLEPLSSEHLLVDEKLHLEAFQDPLAHLKVSVAGNRSDGTTDLCIQEDEVLAVDYITPSHTSSPSPLVKEEVAEEVPSLPRDPNLVISEGEDDDDN